MLLPQDLLVREPSGLTRAQRNEWERQAFPAKPVHWTGATVMNVFGAKEGAVINLNFQVDARHLVSVRLHCPKLTREVYLGINLGDTIEFQGKFPHQVVRWSDSDDGSRSSATIDVEDGTIVGHWRPASAVHAGAPTGGGGCAGAIAAMAVIAGAFVALALNVRG